MNDYSNKLYQLTHPQKRIWYNEKLYPGLPVHNVGGIGKIIGKVNYNKLSKAINAFIEKNEGIRLQMVEENGEAKQYVSEYHYTDIEHFDLSDFNDLELNKWIDHKFNQPLSFYNSPLFYFAILDLKDNNSGILGIYHHIIADGWAVDFCSRQILRIYTQLVRGEEISAENIFSYIDYIESEREYLNSSRFSKNRAYWLEKYKTLPELEVKKYKDSTAGVRKTYQIDETRAEKIRNFTSDSKQTISTIFISALILYLSKITQREDIVIGIPVFNRTDNKQKNMFGMFTSTMPFRFLIDQNDSVQALISKVARELKKGYVNQEYPYDLLVRDLELQKNGYGGLYEVCFNYYNTEFNYQADGQAVEFTEAYNGHQLYPMQIILKEWLGNMVICIDYQKDNYMASQIDDTYEYMMNILLCMAGKQDAVISEIELLSVSESNYYIYELNSTKSNYDSDRTITEIFEKQVFDTPDRIAVSFKNKQLTYSELNERANRLAWRLRSKGVFQETVVGIMTSHSIETIVAILGVLKAGGAYLPIDCSYPNERIKYMIMDAGISIILSNKDIKEKLTGQQIEIINLLDEHSYSQDNHNPGRISFDAEKSLAYIIYTSGSTGTPKGTMVEQRGLVNYICWAKKTYVKSMEDVFPLYSSLSFDLTVTSIFTPLISGNEIIIYDDEKEFPLYSILKDNRATIVKLTPSHLSLIKDIDNSKSSIRAFIVGGEDLRCDLALSIHKNFNANIEIYNEYGPTETVVGCMIYKYDPVRDTDISVPIGVPIDNMRIYILDKNHHAVPVGVCGEIYISGDGVARGYLNKPEVTKERFIKDPFVIGLKMYKSGDLAKYLPDGTIVYAGRIDNQVKIRGHRVELGEIESRIIACDAIKEAVVLDYEEKGSKYLCAYYSTDKGINEKTIRAQLSEKLPDYMIPSNFIRVDALPLTHNGKINRSLLPKPSIEQRKNYKAPKSDKDKIIVDIFEKVLSVKSIGMDDNFFSLGGDSIKAIQITSKLSEKNISMLTRDILTKDTIGQICLAATESGEENSYNQGILSGEFGLTPIINWFVDFGFSNPDYYNQTVLLELKQNMKKEVLQQALALIVKQHDGLRLNYDKGKKKLFFNNSLLENEIVIETYGIDAFYDSEEFREEIRKIGLRLKEGFDIGKDLLIKAGLICGKTKQYLLLTCHHMIIDGISWRILIEQLFNIYHALFNGMLPEIPKKTASIKDWYDRLRLFSESEDILRAFEYWEKINVNDGMLPQDYITKDYSIANINMVKDFISKDATRKLSANAYNVHRYEAMDILVTALAKSVRDWTRLEKFTIELESHGRHFEDIDTTRTIGWFTSIYPVTLEFNKITIENQLKSVMEQLSKVPHKGMSYGVLRYMKQKLFQEHMSEIRFNYLGSVDNNFSDSLFEFSSLDTGNEISEKNNITAKVDINCMVVNGMLNIIISYSKKMYRPDTMEFFLNSIKSNLHQILAFIEESNKSDISFDINTAKINEEDLDLLLE